MGAGDDFGGEGLNGRAGEGKNVYRGGGGVDDQESRKEIEQSLTPEQLQLFAKENQDMLKQYEDTLDQVRSVLLIRHYSHDCMLTRHHLTGQLNVPCLRYPNCRLLWSRISTSKAPTYPSWSQTPFPRQRMLVVGIKSLRERRRERVLPEWYSGLVVDCVGSW